MNNTDLKIVDVGPGLKGINFDAFGGFESFLAATSNGASGSDRPQILRRVLPWLAKAADMTALAVSELPFEIMKGSQVYDTSADWKNKIGGMASPSTLLYNLASSLCLGRAYVIPQAVSGAVISLQYCAPHTVTPNITNRLIDFQRTASFGATTRYLPADLAKGKYENYDGEMMYFWLQDSDVELGPAQSYPASTALLSAELLTSVDSILSVYAQRGFVPATILAAKGMANKDERDKAETWWNRFLRGWTTTVAKIINADAMSVNKVGAGLDELRGIYGELNKQAIENIGTAYGIPAALFMSDMAFASEVNPLIKVWYTTSQFVKIYRCIENTFNTQLLDRYGLTMAFRPETIDAFQEDEVDRTAAMSQFMDTMEKASSIEMAQAMFKIYGVEVDAEAMRLIEAHFAKKEQRAETVAAQTQPVTPPNQPVQADMEPEDEPQPASKALEQWKRKALKRLKDAKTAACEFVSDEISAEENARIRAALAQCKTADEVRAAFERGGAIDPLEARLDRLTLAMERLSNAA